ncbi:MAG: NAD(P)-dependent oxidoreductase [Gammaproteobacteria bacterium]|nr:NAD(P)-dependent oxidoreductase [Gammaproteobacteria bacterium]
MRRQTVFITGTTGSMGAAGLRELLQRRDRFDLVTLVRPSPLNRKKMAHLAGAPGVTIVWGDLTCYDDVLACVSQADIVLHPAALIAPAADHNPAAARTINVGSIDNILRAIKAQPDPDAIKLVNIGSVAMTGDRLYPIHVGRTGDPLKPSIYDAYACTKIDAEQRVAESGLKHWVSCRQTFIAVPDTLSLMDPIMFHQPLETCIEFCTDRDSGLMLANACERDVPDTFWRKFYNIGGGANARITFVQLMERVYGALGLGTPDQLTRRNWFALRNFHCQWFEDSARLDDILHFQSMGVEEYIASILAESPWYVLLPARPGLRWLFANRLARYLVRRLVMQPMACNSRDSTGYWLKHDLQDRISAFFGDRQAWEQIPASWDSIRRPAFDDYQRLDHGYDESLEPAQWRLTDMQAAAEFRGGRCLSSTMSAGDIFQPLHWQCWRGHDFELSPNTVLHGGHWCPQCAPQVAGWDYDTEASHNPFFAQVWTPNHAPSESHFYPADCYLDVLQH